MYGYVLPVDFFVNFNDIFQLLKNCISTLYFFELARCWFVVIWTHYNISWYWNKIIGITANTYFKKIIIECKTIYIPTFQIISMFYCHLSYQFYLYLMFYLFMTFLVVDLKLYFPHRLSLCVLVGSIFRYL